MKKISQGEQRFNAIKDEYLKHYKRTSGNTIKASDIYYSNGYVHFQGFNLINTSHRISEFEKMCATLAERPDYVKPNKTKVAKLVTVTFVTRVIVDKDASDEQIFEAGRKELKRKANEEMFENLEKIEDDVECPYTEKEEQEQV